MLYFKVAYDVLKRLEESSETNKEDLKMITLCLVLIRDKYTELQSSLDEIQERVSEFGIDIEIEQSAHDEVLEKLSMLDADKIEFYLQQFLNSRIIGQVVDEDGVTRFLTEDDLEEIEDELFEEESY